MTVEEFAAQWNNSDDFIEAFTSGSTGSPKRIKLFKEDMVRSAVSTLEFFGIGENATLTCPMDFKYIGAKMMYVRAVVSNSRLVVIRPSNNIEITSPTDLLAVVPSQLDSLLSDTMISHKVKNLIIGGAQINRSQQEAIIKADLNAYVTYGMTETASHVALAKVGDHVYNALPGITFEKDPRDCLIIHLEGRKSNCIMTNDIVDLLNDKSFIWKGRIDNVINSGGIKVHPEILEQEIRDIFIKNHFPTCDIAIVGEKSQKWGEQVALIIETTNPLSHNDLNHIYQLLRQNLQNTFHLPKNIFNHPIPRTENGKPLRHQ